jgi:hypothetical protein
MNAQLGLIVDGLPSTKLSTGDSVMIDAATGSSVVVLDFVLKHPLRM